MGKMISMWADVPHDLQEPHVLLERYATWAWTPSEPRARCGSAEGAFMPTGGQAYEDRREPADFMSTTDARRVQAALLKVDELHRRHLTLLYVQQRRAVMVLKAGHVSPQLSQRRQLDGLRLFAAAHQVLMRQALDTRPLSRDTLTAHR